MRLNEQVRRKIEELITEGGALAGGNIAGQVHGSDHSAACKGWLAAADNIVSICTSPFDAYRNAANRIILSSTTSGLMINDRVGDFVALLTNLLADLDRGLVASVINRTRAETLDDMLHAAEEYHRRGRNEGAGVLSTAVFEDTVRRISRKVELTEAGVNTDTLIAELARGGTISKIVASRCRAAAGVRNKALHAQWGDFTPNDVRTVIDLTRELLETHLSS